VVDLWLYWISDNECYCWCDWKIVVDVVVVWIDVMVIDLLMVGVVCLGDM